MPLDGPSFDAEASVFPASFDYVRADINGLAELDFLEERDGYLRVGATCRDAAPRRSSSRPSSAG